MSDNGTLRLEYIDPADLNANPSNWRKHPKNQTAALAELGRLCYGIEIEPKYVAVCLERMADMGLEPQLSSDKTEH